MRSALVSPPVCPVHGTAAHLVPASVVYRTHRFGGQIWVCADATCTARVGAHPDGTPKGTMATEPLRRARIRAHVAFDGWWNTNSIGRGVAYRFLASEMGLEVAHIGEMTIEQCQRVVEIFDTPEMPPLIASCLYCEWKELASGVDVVASVARLRAALITHCEHRHPQHGTAEARA